MITIPLKAVASQTCTILLDGQYCQLAIYQKATGLYMDLSIDNELVLTCRACLDRVNIVSEEYFGFVGDLQFQDQKGLTEPYYTGLGGRYQLKYLFQDEL